MIHNVYPYPSYKPSGLGWLGEVPEHWGIARLKAHAANIVDLTRELGRDDIYLALEHVESWTGRYSVAGAEVDFESQVKQFRAGDVLFGKLRPYLAKVASPDRSGVCVGEFLVLRPSGADLSPKYLEQLLRSHPVVDAIDASTFGAKMPRADWHFIGGMRIPLPPLPEQRAIVRYLDHADRPHPPLRHRQAEAHRPAGGGEAGCRQPGRYTGPRPQRPPQALRRRVAGRRSRSIGKCGANQECVPIDGVRQIGFCI